MQGLRVERLKVCLKGPWRLVWGSFFGFRLRSVDGICP